MERFEPADVAAFMKVRATRPKTADVLEAFKGKVRDVPGTTKFTVDLNDRKERDKFRELRRPWARAATAWNAEVSARTPKVRVVDTHGSVREIAAADEAEAARGRFLPRTTWSSVRKFAAAPRKYFPCGHYTETAGETVCSWCAEER